LKNRKIERRARNFLDQQFVVSKTYPLRVKNTFVI